jgi:hypothetical protein
VAKIDVDQLEANRQVTLRLEDCVEHGFVPGSIDVVDVYELTARNVSHYEAPFEHFPDHVVDLVEVGETDGVMFIEADVPNILRIECEEIEVVQLPTERRRVPQWVNEEEFSLTASEGALPDAEFWRVRAEKELAAPVAWRMIGGPAATPPAGRYEGWFLQLQEVLDVSKNGVFCSIARSTENGFTVNFDRYGTDDRLWRAVGFAAATGEGVIRSGNCAFTTHEWDRYLRAGELPQTGRSQEGSV